MMSNFDRNSLMIGLHLGGPGGGSGSLPAPTADGVALIGVDGEWKQQSGYGYEEEPAFEPIEWDGDTEGLVHADVDDIPRFYKLSDSIMSKNDLIGSSMTINQLETIMLSEEDVEDFGTAICALYIFSGKAGSYESSSLGVSLSVPEDGTYFFNADGVYASSLTAPSTVQTIDPKFIPMSDIQDMIDEAIGGAADDSY